MLISGSLFFVHTEKENLCLYGLPNETWEVTPLSESEAVDMVKDVFASATERDIYTGDGLEIVVINAAGLWRESIELPKPIFLVSLPLLCMLRTPPAPYAPRPLVADGVFGWGGSSCCLAGSTVYHPLF